MAVKIKLKRMGKIREPYYRIIVADARTKRDGRAIEEIGKYHPKADPSLIEVNSDRAQHWLSVGAQPTDPVRKLLEVTGDWQKFKGLPGAEGTLKTASARTDKKEIFAAAVAETVAEGGASSKGKGKAGGSAKAGDAKAGDAKEGKDAKDARSGRGGKGGSAKPKGDKPDADQPAGEAKAGDAKAGDAKGGAAKAGAAKAGEVTAEAAEGAKTAKASKAKAADETAAAETPAAVETPAAAEPGSGD